jgi:hypothetical protein
LNTYLREFVRLSIDDWVNFIRSFTIPVYDRGELWKVQNTPLMVINLSFQMKDKKKKEDKKKDKKRKKDSNEDIEESN